MALFKIRYITHFVFEIISGYNQFTKKCSFVFKTNINENTRQTNEIIIFEKIVTRRFEILKTENAINGLIARSFNWKNMTVRFILNDKSWVACNNFLYHSSVWLTGRLKRYIHWIWLHILFSFFGFFKSWIVVYGFRTQKFIDKSVLNMFLAQL